MKKVSCVIVGLLLFFVSINVYAKEITISDIVEKFKSNKVLDSQSEQVMKDAVITSSEGEIDITLNGNVNRFFIRSDSEYAGSRRYLINIFSSSGMTKEELSQVIADMGSLEMQLVNGSSITPYIANLLIYKKLFYTVGSLNGYSKKDMDKVLNADVLLSFKHYVNGFDIGVSVVRMYINDFNIDDVLNKVYIADIVEKFKSDEVLDSQSEQVMKEAVITSSEEEIDITLNGNVSRFFIKSDSEDSDSKYLMNIFSSSGMTKEELSKVIADMSNLETQLAHEASITPYLANLLIYKKLFYTVGSLNGYSKKDIDKVLNVDRLLSLNHQVNGFNIGMLGSDDSNSEKKYANVRMYINEFNIDDILKTASNIEAQRDKDTNKANIKKCTEDGEKYYDKNGNAVSKEAYYSSCGVVDNPKTGSYIPYALVAVSFVIISLMYCFTRKNRIFKV